MTNNTPQMGTKKSPAAKQTGSKTTQNTKAPAKKATRKKKDGNADPTSPAEAEAVNTQPPSAGIEESMETIVSSVTEIGSMDLKGVQTELLASATEHGKQEVLAISAGKLMLAYGWKIGTLLARAKILLKGNKTKKFGPWRKEFLLAPGSMSVKTSQRYMALAKHWADLGSLLSAKVNLWDAYQGLGILPSDEALKVGKKDDDDSKTHPRVDPLSAYLAKFSQLQKVLRGLSELKGKISGEIPEAKQKLLDEMVKEIIGFANQLRGEEA